MYLGTRTKFVYQSDRVNTVLFFPFTSLPVCQIILATSQHSSGFLVKHFLLSFLLLFLFCFSFSLASKYFSDRDTYSADMNWTEGNLARHSRGRKGKETLKRQKEHFAKARSSFLNTNVKMSPPSISFFAHPAHSSAPVRHHSSKSIPPSPSKKRTRENSPLQTSRYFKDSSLELPSLASLEKDQAEEDALRLKRQKLLQKGDWVGTNVQKPIQMEFSEPRISVGNPWGARRTRHHPSKQRLRHLLGIKAPSGQDRAAQPAFRAMTPFTRSQLRVRVGSQERAFTGSSTASPRSRRWGDVDSSRGMCIVAFLTA